MLPGGDNPRDVLASDPRVLALYRDGSMIESTDGGVTWRAQTPPPREVYTGWAAPDGFYVGGPLGALYRSTRGGAWVEVKFEYVSDIVDGYVEAGKLVVLWNKHLWPEEKGTKFSPASLSVSGDNGATWTTTEVASSDQGLVCGVGATMVVGGAFGEVRRSADGGRTWKLTKLPTDDSAVGLWTDGATIVVGLHDGEIWRGP